MYVQRWPLMAERLPYGFRVEIVYPCVIEIGDHLGLNNWALCLSTAGELVLIPGCLKSKPSFLFGAI